MKPHESLEVVTGCIGLAQRVVKGIAKRNAVIVLGKTGKDDKVNEKNEHVSAKFILSQSSGSGKSTFMNWVVGCEMEPQTLIYPDGRKKTVGSHCSLYLLLLFVADPCLHLFFYCLPRFL